MKTILIISCAILLAGNSLAATKWLPGQWYAAWQTTAGVVEGCLGADDKPGMNAHYYTSTATAEKNKCTTRNGATSGSVTGVTHYAANMAKEVKVLGNHRNLECKPGQGIKQGLTGGALITPTCVAIAAAQVGCDVMCENGADATKLGCCTRLSAGYGYKKGTGDLFYDATNMAAVVNTCTTGAKADSTNNCFNCQSDGTATAANKGKCAECYFGYSLQGTGTTCVANTAEPGCAKQTSSTVSDCERCHRGCFFNGKKCQCHQLSNPNVLNSDKCMETAADSKCLACFNDPNATEGGRSLSVSGGGGNCATKITSTEKVAGADYNNGKWTNASTTVTQDQYMCSGGKVFEYNATDIKKSTCKALATGSIKDCKYHSRLGTAGTVKCIQCNDGKKSSSAALTDCTGTVATNAVKYRNSNDSIWECKSGFVVDDDSRGSCVTWSGTGVDPNCRARATWKLDGTNTLTPCVACKDGYYFSGNWCIKGTTSSTSSTTSSTSSTASTTSTTSTTTKASGFLNIFAAGLTAAFAVAFN